jgi:hypothetical protein
MGKRVISEIMQKQNVLLLADFALDCVVKCSWVGVCEGSVKFW